MFLVLCSFLLPSDEIKVINLDDFLKPEDSLEYENFRVKRACEFKDFITCRYVVSKNGINLLTYPEGGEGMEGGVVLGDEKGGILHPDFLKTGFLYLTKKEEVRLVKPPAVKPEKKEPVVPLIEVTSEVTAEVKEPVLPPLPKKDLVLMDYTGGAHCCWEYSIYSLDPDFKVVFDNYKWKTGYGLSYADLDKDGVQELIQASLTYDYGFNRPHVDSAFPLVVFKFDAKAGMYLPANRQYKEYILSELKKIVLNEVNDKEPDISPVVQHVLTYLYLGQDKDAWAVYDKYYKLKNKETLKKEIIAAVAKDPVFRYLSKK